MGKDEKAEPALKKSELEMEVKQDPSQLKSAESQKDKSKEGSGKEDQQEPVAVAERAAEKTEGKTAPQKSGEGSQKAKSSELEKEVKQESLPDIFVRQMSTRCLLPDSLLKKEA